MPPCGDKVGDPYTEWCQSSGEHIAIKTLVKGVSFRENTHINKIFLNQIFS